MLLRSFLSEVRALIRMIAAVGSYPGVNSPGGYPPCPPAKCKRHLNVQQRAYASSNVLATTALTHVMCLSTAQPDPTVAISHPTLVLIVFFFVLTNAFGFRNPL